MQSVFSAVDKTSFEASTIIEHKGEKHLTGISLVKRQGVSRSQGQSILALLAPDVILEDYNSVLPSQVSIGIESFHSAKGFERIMAVNAFFENYLITDGFLRNIAVHNGLLKIVHEQYSLHIRSTAERMNILIVDQEERSLSYDEQVFKNELASLCRRIHSAETLRMAFDGGFTIP